MPLPDPEKQRAFALEVVRRLRDAGYEAYWAGGCVRDRLLGQMPKDYDVATSATPNEIRDVFGRRRTLAIGAAFGVITVLGPRQAGQIEVATFRSDAGYSDGRHPDRVTFTNAEEDARRRDFTMNGLFYDPLERRVIDFVGGQADLKSHLVRAIGTPADRFEEDKLRMLRAVRFAAALDFKIERKTLAAIRSSAADITSVSAERIGAEISRMLTDRYRSRALELLRATKLLVAVLVEVAALDAKRWDELLRVADRLRRPSVSLALAALAHQFEDPEVAGTIGRRLRFTNKEVGSARWILQNLPVTRRAASVPWPRLQPVLVHQDSADLVALHEAITGPDDPDLKVCRQRLALPAEQLNPEPLIDGSDLIAAGLEPGPRFTVLLEQVRSAQLEGKIQTRQQAMDLIKLRHGHGVDSES